MPAAWCLAYRPLLALQGRDRGLAIDRMLRRITVWMPLRRYWSKWVVEAQRSAQMAERENFRSRLAQFGASIGAVSTHAAARRLFDVFKVRRPASVVLLAGCACCACCAVFATARELTPSLARVPVDSLRVRIG